MEPANIQNFRYRFNGNFIVFQMIKKQRMYWNICQNKNVTATKLNVTVTQK